MTTLLALIGIKASSSMVKWISLGIGALVIVVTILGAFWYVRSLSDDLAKARSELAIERQLRERLQSELTLVRAQQLRQIENIKTLDAMNTSADARWASLLAELDSVNLKGPADAAVADLNRLNRAANRMLETATAGAHN